MGGKLDAIRAAVDAAERMAGADRIRALAKVRAAVQELEDRELLELLEKRSAYDVAPAIGITPPSVYARAKNARRRLAEKRDARTTGEVRASGPSD